MVIRFPGEETQRFPIDLHAQSNSHWNIRKGAQTDRRMDLIMWFTEPKNLRLEKPNKSKRLLSMAAS